MVHRILAVLITLSCFGLLYVQSDLSWEMESLELDSTLTTSAPSVIQNMADFSGSFWSANNQLFIKNTKGNERTAFRIPITRTAKYEILLMHTVAPDYGRYKVSIDGHQVATLDGYFPLLGRRVLSIGKYDLGKSMQTLVFQSDGYATSLDKAYLGLDQIILRDTQKWLFRMICWALLFGAMLFYFQRFLHTKLFLKGLSTFSKHIDYSDGANKVNRRTFTRIICIEAIALLSVYYGVFELSSAAPFQINAWLLIFLGVSIVLLQRYWISISIKNSEDLKSTSAYEEKDIEKQELKINFLFSAAQRVSLFLLVLLFSIIAWFGYFQLSDNLIGLSDSLWLASIALTIVLFAFKTSVKSQQQQEVIALVLAFVGVVAFFLRHAILTELPFYVHGDEGEHARSVQSLILGTNNVIGFGWFSFPNFGYFIQSIAVRLYGLSVYGMRMSSVIVGVATVFAVYAWARAAFCARTALVAAWLATWFHVFLYFSRIAITNIQVSFLTAITCATLTYALRFKSLELCLLTGLWAGLGFHTYSAGQVIAPIVIVTLLTCGLKNRLEWGFLCRALSAFAFGMIISVGPFLVEILYRSNLLYARSAMVSIFKPEILEAHKILLETPYVGVTIIKQFFMNLLSTICIDSHDIGGWYGHGVRMFAPLFGALLITAFFAALYSVIRSLRSNDLWQRSRIFLPLTVIILTSAVASITENAPSWQRLMPIYPAVLVLLAGQLEAHGKLLDRLFKSIPLGLLLLLIYCGYFAVFNYQTWFQNPRQRESDASMQAFLTRFISSVPTTSHVYLFGNLPNRLITYATFYDYGAIWLQRPNGLGSDIPEYGPDLKLNIRKYLETNSDAAFVFFKSDEDVIYPYLNELWPNGFKYDWQIKQNNNGIVAYLVNKENLQSPQEHY